jgi:hypothetical protein
MHRRLRSVANDVPAVLHDKVEMKAARALVSATSLLFDAVDEAYVTLVLTGQRSVTAECVECRLASRRMPGRVSESCAWKMRSRCAT